MSQDPLGLWGGDSNIYRYVLNQPTKFTDWRGLAVDEKTREALDKLIAKNAKAALSKTCGPDVGKNKVEAQRLSDEVQRQTTLEPDDEYERKADRALKEACNNVVQCVRK